MKHLFLVLSLSSLMLSAPTSKAQNPPKWCPDQLLPNTSTIFEQGGSRVSVAIELLAEMFKGRDFWGKFTFYERGINDKWDVRGKQGDASMELFVPTPGSLDPNVGVSFSNRTPPSDRMLSRTFLLRGGKAPLVVYSPVDYADTLADLKSGQIHPLRRVTKLAVSETNRSITLRFPDHFGTGGPVTIMITQPIRGGTVIISEETPITKFILELPSERR